VLFPAAKKKPQKT